MNRPREIAHGIKLFAARTPTLPPATHTNCYALGTAQVLLVDPAPSDAHEQQAMIEWLRALRSEGRSLVGCVVTHHHRDHVGAAVVLRREAGIALWAHEQTQARLPDVPMDRLLQDGDELKLLGPAAQRWQVLHTPGHAPGHLCLHEQQLGVLVLGDMVATRGTILIAPGDGDMATYLTQLERLATLHAKLGLPSHGHPIERPSVVLLATHAHRLMREGKVLDALRGERSATLQQLLPVVYDDTPMALWPLASRSLQAHLDKLIRDGVVRSCDTSRFALVAQEGRSTTRSTRNDEP